MTPCLCARQIATTLPKISPMVLVVSTCMHGDDWHASEHYWSFEGRSFWTILISWIFVFSNRYPCVLTVISLSLELNLGCKAIRFQRGQSKGSPPMRFKIFMPMPMCMPNCACAWQIATRSGQHSVLGWAIGYVKLLQKPSNLDSWCHLLVI